MLYLYCFHVTLFLLFLSSSHLTIFSFFLRLISTILEHEDFLLYGLISILSFNEERIFFVFQALQVPYWNKRMFLILWLKSAIFSKCFFLFFELRSSLLKYFILIVRKFYFLKYKSSILPFSRNLRTAFFSEILRSFFKVFISWSIRNILILEP